MISDSWQSYAKELSEINHLPIDEFFQQPVVQKTLYYGVSINRLNELAALQGTRLHEIVTTEFLPTSGTVIQQAYSLHLVEEHIGPISSFDTIFEFGAGYGEMARLLDHCAFSGDYYSFDIPELIAVQKSYNSIDNFSVTYLDDINQLPDLKPDLFIAICSLSETPLPLRRHFVDLEPHSICIRFQPMWDGIDNEHFFHEWSTFYPYSHTQYAVDFPAHIHLVAHE